MLNRVVAAIGVGLLLAACGVSKDEFAAAQKDAANYKKQYADEQQKSAALEKKVADLQAQNEALTKSTTQLTEEKGQLEAKSKQYEELTSSLQGQIQSGQVEISELRGKMMVKLKDKVVFSSGSAAMNKQGREALDAVANAFHDLQGKNVVVAGYTDNVPGGREGGLQGQLGPLDGPSGERRPVSPIEGRGAEDTRGGGLLRVPATRRERLGRGQSQNRRN